MTLMNAIKELCNVNYDKYEDYFDLEIELSDILDCIEDRVDFIEEREPNSDGELYDRWLDKLDDLNDIRDSFEEYMDLCEKYYDGEVEKESRKRKCKEAIESIYRDVESYQNTHGGLKRLTV